MNGDIETNLFVKPCLLEDSNEWEAAHVIEYGLLPPNTSFIASCRHLSSGCILSIICLCVNVWYMVERKGGVTS